MFVDLLKNISGTTYTDTSEKGELQLRMNLRFSYSTNYKLVDMKILDIGGIRQGAVVRQLYETKRGSPIPNLKVSFMRTANIYYRVFNGNRYTGCGVLGWRSIIILKRKNSVYRPCPLPGVFICNRRGGIFNYQ